MSNISELLTKTVFQQWFGDTHWHFLKSHAKITILADCLLYLQMEEKKLKYLVIIPHETLNYHNSYTLIFLKKYSM